ncbi:2838_t:CDS:2, partial [Gigaspora margarita]
PRLKEFMEHYCQVRHYFFTIKKCGNESFPGDDLHYKSFEQLYGTTTTEEYRPSFKDAKLRTTKSGKIKTTMKHTMPFSPSSIRAKNVGITITCVECEKPRLLFSAKKLLLKEYEML